MYYIYIVRCDDQSLYTGITTDLKRRLNEHILKLPQGAAYTKSRNVTRLEALWSAEDRSLASKLEYKIKQLTKLKKEQLILKSEDDDSYIRITDLSEYDELFV